MRPVACMRAVVNVRTRLESVSVGVSRRKYLKICMYADMLARMHAHVETPDQPISRPYELICLVNLAFAPEAHIIQQLRRFCLKRREIVSTDWFQLEYPIWYRYTIQEPMGYLLRQSHSSKQAQTLSVGALHWLSSNLLRGGSQVSYECPGTARSICFLWLSRRRERLIEKSPSLTCWWSMFARSGLFVLLW